METTKGRWNFSFMMPSFDCINAESAIIIFVRTLFWFEFDYVRYNCFPARLYYSKMCSRQLNWIASASTNMSNKKIGSSVKTRIRKKKKKIGTKTKLTHKISSSSHWTVILWNGRIVKWNSPEKSNVKSSPEYNCSDRGLRMVHLDITFTIEKRNTSVLIFLV